MKRQDGGISGALIAVLIFFGIIFSTVFVCLTSYVSANNYGAKIEAQLNAERDNNQNVLAQGQQKVLEAAQVPGMMRDDFSKVAKDAISGRYGAEGSKAVVQWIKEQNPNLDSKVYVKIQQLIEAYRDEFKTSQTKMIDVRRQYEASLGLFWRGMWLRMAGFPKIDLTMFKPIITDRVEDVYKNGKESSPLQLR